MNWQSASTSALRLRWCAILVRFAHLVFMPLDRIGPGEISTAARAFHLHDVREFLQWSFQIRGNPEVIDLRARFESAHGSEEFVPCCFDTVGPRRNLAFMGIPVNHAEDCMDIVARRVGLVCSSDRSEPPSSMLRTVEDVTT